MKQYRIQTVPTKRGAFIRSRINKTRARAQLVGILYLIATAVVSVLGCRAMFSSVYDNMGLKQFWRPFLAMDLSSSFGIMRLVTSALYALMLVILLINGIRALSHLKYLFKKKVSRIYGLNANLGAMETLGDIFSSSFSSVIIFNVLLYVLQGGMAWSPIFLVGAPYTVLLVGIAVHLVCGILGSKTSAFYIQNGSEVIERKRPFGRIIPLVRNLLQLVAVFYIAYLFLTSEQIHTIINVYLMEGGFESLMANMMGLIPVALQLLSFFFLCALFKHAFSCTEFSAEGPFAPGRRTYRIASFFLALASAGVVACKYFIGEAVYTIPDIQGTVFSVETVVGLDMNSLIIAVVAFVMFLLDCILRLRWTKEAKAEMVEDVEKAPVVVPAPKVNVHVPPSNIAVNMPAQRPTPVSVYVPQQQLPAMPPINVHVPRQQAAIPNVNVHMPQQAPINVHVPMQATPNVNVQMPRQAPVSVYVPQQQIPAMPPINVHVPKQAPMAAQPINIQMPAQKPTVMPPINVHVPKQAPMAAQPINIQMPAQKPMTMPPITVNVPQQQHAAQPINVHMPAPAAQPIQVNVPKQQIAMPPVNVQLPKQAPIQVKVPAPAAQPINIQMPEQAKVQPINVNMPANAQPINVNVPEQKAAPINVHVPEQKGGLTLDKVPPISLLHLENDTVATEAAAQPMPPVNPQVLEQPAPQIVCPLANKEEVKEEPEVQEEATPAVLPIVAPMIAPVDMDDEEEEQEEEWRSWQLRCPTCSKLIKTKVGSQYHRCPCCGKVFHLQKKFKNILDE